MTADTSADVVLRLHAALDRRDLDAVMALMHPDVQFEDFVDGGPLAGLVEVRAFYQRLFDTLSPGFDILATENLPGGRVRVDMQVVVHDSAGHVWSDSRSGATYTLTDGLVTGVVLERP